MEHRIQIILLDQIIRRCSALSNLQAQVITQVTGAVREGNTERYTGFCDVIALYDQVRIVTGKTSLQHKPFKGTIIIMAPECVFKSAGYTIRIGEAVTGGA